MRRRCLLLSSLRGLPHTRVFLSFFRPKSPIPTHITRQASVGADSSAAGSLAKGHERAPALTQEERRLKQRCMSLWSKANNFKVAHHFRRKVRCWAGCEVLGVGVDVVVVRSLAWPTKQK